MKKRVLLLLLVVLGLFFVGCATTKDTEVFRFEVRELKLTISIQSESKEKELKLIRGDADKKATIVYTVTCVEGEKAGQIDMDNGIIKVVGTGTTDEGYATTGEGETVKIIPLSEGVVKFNAFIKGRENVADSIVVTVTKEIMSGFKVSAVFPEIYVGTTTGFRTSAIPSYLDSSVLKYEVSDEKIATINDNGVLKGLSTGTVTVKAYSSYDPSMYSLTTVKVSYAQAGSVVVFDADEFEIEDDIVLTNGDKYPISTLVKPKDTSLKTESVSQKVTYKSSDTKVFNVNTDEEGNVSIVATGGGEATLTVESDDKKAKFESVVIVNWGQTESFAVKQEEMDIAVKKSMTVERVDVQPANANPDFNVDYKSDEDKEIVSINGYKVEGLKPGVAYLVVTTIESGTNVPISLEVKVTVSYDTIEEINITTRDISMMTGDSKFTDGEYSTQIKWSLKPAGSNPAVTLESSDTSIATVDNEGNLIIKDKVGTAIITITSVDNPEVKAELKVAVTSKPTGFTVEAPEDGTSFVYSDDLTITFTITITPDTAPQDEFDIDFDSEDNNCYIEFDFNANVVTLVLDPDSLGTFDIIITVSGVSGEWIRTYTVTLPAE